MALINPSFLLFALLPLALQAQAAVPVWGQCGGLQYTGDTQCTPGNICQQWNPYYVSSSYQCIPGPSTSTTSTRPTSTTTSTRSSTTSTRTSTTSTRSSTTSTRTSSTTSTRPTSTSTSTSTRPPSSSTVPTSSTTYTGTLPIVTLSPTGLATLAKPKNRYIGSAFDNNRVSDNAYAKIVLSNVNQITCENSMKWESIEATQGTFSSYSADEMVKLAQLNNLTIRGHTLVWHSQLPSWVSNGSWTNATLIDVMTKHITGVMNKYKGQIHTWDVVNEVVGDDGNMRPSIFYNTIGEYFIDIAFKTAKSVDPTPILAINDYNIEGSGSKSTTFLNLVTRVKARGAPIEQIGIQSHLIVGSLPGGISSLWASYAALGVSIAITELDIRMPTPPTASSLAQQATDYTTMVNACLNQPKCIGITIWALSDKYSWVPDVFSGQGAALPYDENLQPKPAYTAIQQALSA
ncbi:hypothetical protein FRC17_003364 [Serendipita sp. 399]|nr:hypothetical protein FRC17_003364 [Serendipita sp. 399]